jgi:hypothetical protein
MGRLNFLAPSVSKLFNFLELIQVNYKAVY